MSDDLVATLQRKVERQRADIVRLLDRNKKLEETMVERLDFPGPEVHAEVTASGDQLCANCRNELASAQPQEIGHGG